MKDNETRRAYVLGYLVAIPTVLLGFAGILYAYGSALARHGL